MCFYEKIMIIRAQIIKFNKTEPYKYDYICLKIYMIKQSIVFIIFLSTISSCSEIQESIDRSNKRIEKNKYKQNSNDFKERKIFNDNYDEIFYSNFRYKGDFKKGYVWEDALGKNYLIISGTSSYWDIESIHPEQRDEGFIVDKLYGYHYVESDEKTRLLWDLKEYSDDGMYIWVNELSITDLDNDDIVETCIAYDSKQIKVIMHESDKKYAIRGSIQSKIDEFGEAYNEWNYEMYGRDSFQNANEKFKAHALDLWEKIADIFTVG